MIRRVVTVLFMLLFAGRVVAVADESLIEKIEVLAPLNAPDDGTYWMQARPAIIPADEAGNGTKPPRVVITLQKIDRMGTHLYHGIAALWTNDLGVTWTQPEALKSVDRIILGDHLVEAPADMTPQFHERSGTLLVTGVSFVLDPKLKRDVPQGASDTAYTVFRPKSGQWSQRQKLEMPGGPKFYFARAGCTQRVDLPNGDVLLPIYFQAKDSTQAFATVVRCSFDGHTLKYIEHGDELTFDGKDGYRGHGLYEPSLTKFGGKFLLTMRGVERAYVSTSEDGLRFSKPIPWKFDDGKELGSLNTQQHWVTHSDGIFLAYTRIGAQNKQVFRSRTPLFIARVDPERLVIERATEQIVLPNLGKAFGNFGVCHVTENETWITDCLTGADPGTPNLYVAKIRWSRPNRLASN